MRPLVDSIVECFAVTDLLIQGHVSHPLFHPLPSLPLFARSRPRSSALASVATRVALYRPWLIRKARLLSPALKFLSAFFIPPVEMNVRDSDGSDSFEGDSMLEDSGSSSRMSNQQHMTTLQSQWKGKRGKPRCDYCRMNKLKVRPPTLIDKPETHYVSNQCDREQPICNHCSWSSLGDCKYTPLPTPAHRGIPRCDRCRLRDLKVGHVISPMSLLLTPDLSHRFSATEICQFVTIVKWTPQTAITLPKNAIGCLPMETVPSPPH